MILQAYRDLKLDFLSHRYASGISKGDGLYFNRIYKNFSSTDILFVSEGSEDDHEQNVQYCLERLVEDDLRIINPEYQFAKIQNLTGLDITSHNRVYR